jgi:hypothetical protein
MNNPLALKEKLPSNLKTGFLRASSTYWMPEPIKIPAPANTTPMGALTVQKEENGTIKGFEYQCVCGRKDYFICE